MQATNPDFWSVGEKGGTTTRQLRLRRWGVWSHRRRTAAYCMLCRVDPRELPSSVQVLLLHTVCLLLRAGLPSHPFPGLPVTGGVPASAGSGETVAAWSSLPAPQLSPGLVVPGSLSHPTPHRRVCERCRHMSRPGRQHVAAPAPPGVFRGVRTLVVAARQGPPSAGDGGASADYTRSSCRRAAAASRGAEQIGDLHASIVAHSATELKLRPDPRRPVMSPPTTDLGGHLGTLRKRG